MFKKKHKKSLRIAIITSIVTAILTTIGSFLILNIQNRLIKANAIAQYRHELLKDFSESTFELEQLRKQAYWNKFSCVLEIKNKELLMKSFPYEKYNLLKQDNQFIANETEIRFKYQKVSSKVHSLTILIPAYFESVNNKQLDHFYQSMSNGFGFDIEFMEDLYDKQSLLVNDGEELYDILNDSISNRYNNQFYNESLEIISLMSKEI